MSCASSPQSSRPSRRSTLFRRHRTPELIQIGALVRRRAAGRHHGKPALHARRRPARASLRRSSGGCGTSGWRAAPRKAVAAATACAARGTTTSGVSSIPNRRASCSTSRTRWMVGSAGCAGVEQRAFPARAFLGHETDAHAPGDRRHYGRPVAALSGNREIVAPPELADQRRHLQRPRLLRQGDHAIDVRDCRRGCLRCRRTPACRCARPAGRASRRDERRRHQHVAEPPERDDQHARLRRQAKRRMTRQDSPPDRRATAARGLFDGLVLTWRILPSSGRPAPPSPSPPWRRASSAGLPAAPCRRRSAAPSRSRPRCRAR